MTEYYGNAKNGVDIQEPLHTVTSKDREGVTLAHISKYYGGADGSAATDPLGTVTSVDHNAVTATFISKFYKTSIGQESKEPLHTITQSPGHFGEVHTRLIKYVNGQELGHWPKVRKLLNRYCGYTMADDEILLLELYGLQWFISDIGLRMLTPKELYAANGFPEDYVIDRDYTGKAYTKSKQVARCGNAVPPPFATALVRANCPDLCVSKSDLSTMKELSDMIAI